MFKYNRKPVLAIVGSEPPQANHWRLHPATVRELYDHVLFECQTQDRPNRLPPFASSRSQYHWIRGRQLRRIDTENCR